MTFYQKMRVVCLSIPRGKVATYGQIALLCGSPRSARRVGYGLKMGLAGDVPAHRVVNGKGELSGAGHFALPGLQKQLLEAEGIRVARSGKGWRADLKEYGWRTGPQEAEAFRKGFEQN